MTDFFAGWNKFVGIHDYSGIPFSIGSDGESDLVI
jgi:hypothetical protein